MEFAPGVAIGNYTLHALIGRGSSGEVWRGVRNVDGQVVALKFMGENLITSQNAAKHHERMQREVDSLRRLRHPNIPAFIDADLNHNPPYLVMAYIMGEGFDKLFNRGEMLHIPLRQRVVMLAALADALGAAHDLGIVHRDVKPANMIAGEHPFLIDFGLAVSADHNRLTMMGVGTTYYMPPETNIPDSLSDIYSFGIVTYEVLFGVHPIYVPEDGYSNNQLVMLNKATERLAAGTWRVPSRVPRSEFPPDMLYSDIPALDAAFTKVMSSRERRYTSVRQFMADIQAAVKFPPAGIKIGATTRELQRIENMPTQIEPASGSAVTDSTQEDRFTVLEVEKSDEAPAVHSNASDQREDDANKKKRWRLFGGKS